MIHSWINYMLANNKNDSDRKNLEMQLKSRTLRLWVPAITGQGAHKPERAGKSGEAFKATRGHQGARPGPAQRWRGARCREHDQQDRLGSISAALAAHPECSSRALPIYGSRLGSLCILHTLRRPPMLPSVKLSIPKKQKHSPSQLLFRPRPTPKAARIKAWRVHADSWPGHPNIHVSLCYHCWTAKCQLP